MDAVGQSLGTVNLIGLINVDSVGVLQDVVAPGRQEVSLVVKDHHGVITTAVYVHTILTVDPDSVDPTEGPGLIFVVLPTAFASMPGGFLSGPIFFLLLVLFLGLVLELPQLLLNILG